MTIPEIKLYELLKAKIGAAEAEAFVEVMEKKVDQKFERIKGELATKEELFRGLTKLGTEMTSMRTELLRRIYQTTVGQVIAIVASVVSIILLLRK